MRLTPIRSDRPERGARDDLARLHVCGYNTKTPGRNRDVSLDGALTTHLTVFMQRIPAPPAIILLHSSRIRRMHVSWTFYSARWLKHAFQKTVEINLPRLHDTVVRVKPGRLPRKIRTNIYYGVFYCARKVLHEEL